MQSYILAVLFPVNFSLLLTFSCLIFYHSETQAYLEVSSENHHSFWKLLSIPETNEYEYVLLSKLTEVCGLRMEVRLPELLI